MKKQSSGLVGLTKTSWIKDNLVQVTEANRTTILHQGTVLYWVVIKDKNNAEIKNIFEILPKLSKGKYTVSNMYINGRVAPDFSVYIDTDEEISKERDAIMNEFILNRIREGVIYVNPKDKIVKFNK